MKSWRRIASAKPNFPRQFTSSKIASRFPNQINPACSKLSKPLSILEREPPISIIPNHQSRSHSPQLGPTQKPASLSARQPPRYSLSTPLSALARSAVALDASSESISKNPSQIPHSASNKVRSNLSKESVEKNVSEISFVTAKNETSTSIPHGKTSIMILKNGSTMEIVEQAHLKI